MLARTLRPLTQRRAFVLLASCFIVGGVVSPSAALSADGPLRLVMTATPDPVGPGEQLFYQVTVTNQSTIPLAGVSLRLRLPAGSDGSPPPVQGG